MLLSSFSYKTSGWELVEMSSLHLTNLLVGKNASGKTRTIKALQSVTSYLQTAPMVPSAVSFKTRLSFVEPGDEAWVLSYEFDVANGKVQKEVLSVCGNMLVKRDQNRALFNGEIINPPNDKLTVQVRRDREAYPEIEKLMTWAEGVVAISCSDIIPLTLLRGLMGRTNPLSFGKLVKALTKEERKHVLITAKRLGYNLVEIAPFDAGSDLELVAVKERFTQTTLLDFQLSSGMLRVLYILCFLQYIKHGRNSILLIDDLGEGLDYNRVTLLGQMVYEECEDANLQLIASSNDSFLMDVVDISKWQILRRAHSKLSVLNQTNSPALFREFRMTGLSNFDLFSSDFIDNYFVRNQG